jgi:cold shock protein
MPNGTVKFFNAGKGFGFITADEGGKDVFVPSASVTASGLATLKPGQRISFEEVPDAKGPKAANLTLLAEAPRPAPEKERPRPPEKVPSARLTYYHDPASDWSEHVLEEIRALGHDPLVVNYPETPPAKDKLRTLSRLLQGRNQSLVRKQDALFFALQLDDRFIGESEFWDAIVEHPALINGPLLASDDRASLMHTDESVPAFFAPAPADNQPVIKPKGLSLRALAILSGGVVPPPAGPAAAPVAAPAETRPAEAPAKAAKLAEPQEAAKPQAKAAARLAPKEAAAKPKAPVRKPAAKPKAKAAKPAKRR